MPTYLYQNIILLSPSEEAREIYDKFRQNYRKLKKSEN